MYCKFSVEQIAVILSEIISLAPLYCIYDVRCCIWRGMKEITDKDFSAISVRDGPLEIKLKKFLPAVVPKKYSCTPPPPPTPPHLFLVSVPNRVISDSRTIRLILSRPSD